MKRDCEEFQKLLWEALISVNQGHEVVHSGGNTGRRRNRSESYTEGCATCLGWVGFMTRELLFTKS